MKKIIVMMSTYNGEKYLCEQIDSILNQENVEVRLLVRDDGSTDKTIDILEEYSKKDKRISFYIGENLGPGSSFFHLVKNVSDCEYYAFSDQDDIWNPSKLCSALEMIKEIKEPVLYHSNLTIVDEKLNVLRLAHTRKVKEDNKYYALARNYATGCTIVINRKAKDMLKSHIPEDSEVLHDSWLYMMCSLMGKVVYDSNSYILYRQHNANVIGMHKQDIGNLKKRFVRLLDDTRQPRYVAACRFYKYFGDELQSDVKEKVLKIVNYKNSNMDLLRLCFDWRIRERSLLSDLRYRFLIVIKRI